MDLSLEEHLETICPNCGQEHDSDWKVSFERHKTYLQKTCTKCEYLIFKESEFMMSGDV